MLNPKQGAFLCYRFCGEGDEVVNMKFTELHDT